MQVELASAVVDGVRTFRCAHCGYEARASVKGLGEGAASFLNADGTSQRRAREDAEADLQRTLDVARCPRCQRRSGVGGWWWRHSWPVGLTVVFMALMLWAPWLLGMEMSPRGSPLWMGLIGTPCVVLIALPFWLLSVWPKWSSLEARVKFE